MLVFTNLLSNTKQNDKALFLKYQIGQDNSDLREHSCKEWGESKHSYTVDRIANWGKVFWRMNWHY